ncbi:MAG: 30S ribosomal protein S9 [Bacteroidetes bacterium]|nr:30S ribosomal protein S9 [Bacteroidota bacterium]MCB0845742.1 30S ribosomal protein S9 [Bacteroidota bacterium]
MSQIVKVGRRKRAIARVFLQEGGTGKFEVNNKEMKDFFTLATLRIRVMDPFAASGANANNFDISVNVNGGGITGQADAIRMGLSRALTEHDEELKPSLKKAGLLTRDARKVERKKYGKKKARKSTQFSKR